MTAICDNFVVLDQVNQIRNAILRLSKIGLLVRRISGGGRVPAIEIDRPLDGLAVAVTRQENKTFFSVDFQQCRVYWVIENPVNQSGGLA